MMFLALCYNSYGQVTYSKSSNPYYINSTNNPPIGYEDGIIIEDGALLIIEDRDGIIKSKLKFNFNTQIIVENGGHLILKNSILENNTSEFWKGIDVYGQSDFEQYIIAPKIPNSPNSSTVTEWLGVLNNQMGIVESYNSSIICAFYGISSWQGGILWIEGKNSNCTATFLNCQYGISIHEYESILCPDVNACHIIQCDFLWDTFKSNYTLETLTGIELQRVKGINIGGCNFINSINMKFCLNYRGTGIKSIRSNFNLSNSGNSFFYDEKGCLENKYIYPNPNSYISRGNNFQQLTYGVSFELDFQNEYFSFNSIRNSNFTNNIFSVAAVENASLIINNCNFNAERYVLDNLFDYHYLDALGHYIDCGFQYFPSWTPVEFISTSISSGIRIFENNFNFNDKYIHYIYIRNADYHSPNYYSEIKMNNFTNTFSSGGATNSDDVKGVILDGACNNLKVTCNQFNSIGNDIYINNNGRVSDFIIDNGIQTAPMNIHSLTIPNRNNVYNNSSLMTQWPTYFYKTTPPTGPPPPSPNYHVYTQIAINGSTCAYSCNDLINGLPEPESCNIGSNNSINLLKKPLLKIYPNPCSNKIYIDDKFSFVDMNYPIIITNSNGIILKYLFVYDLYKNNMTIDVSDLKTGLYFININTSNKNYFNKINIFNEN